MSTAVKQLGPEDHSRVMTFDEYMAATDREGYHYELIDERLYVSPHMRLPQAMVDHWLFFKLHYYERDHPDIINYVTNKALVCVPKRKKATVVRPSIAVFRNLPPERLLVCPRWQDVSPLLVVEVLCIDDSEKDTVRNVELYLQVPTIKQYWLIDTRNGADHPAMRVHDKVRGRWRIMDFVYGDTYTTRLLPGFSLVLDPTR